jgi:hypothetical protein
MTLSEDKEIAVFSHRLTVRRILIDKLFLGLLLVILGIRANFFIEKYKAKMTSQQFFSEKKLFVVMDIREKYSELTKSFYGITKNFCEKKYWIPVEIQSYLDTTKEMAHLVNTKSILLSTKSIDAAACVINLHEGVTTRKLNEWCDYRKFISDISDYFTFVLRLEINPEESIKESVFKPVIKDIDEIDAMGVESYFDMNLKKWQESNKK